MLKPTKNLSNNSSHCCKWMNITVSSSKTVQLLILLPLLWRFCMNFCENVISQGVWPPISPDLTSPDFFLWSYLKDTVYWTKPRDLKQLKMNITCAIDKVNERTLRKVARNMVKRVNKRTEMNGHHFQHIL
jgi:hypothetical protein